MVIAGGVFAAQIPWLIFGLRAGAIVDRIDRRRVIMAVDSVRTVLLAVLAVTVATGTASVPIVYAILFASGVGDTLVMTAGITFVPSLVPRASMTRAVLAHHRHPPDRCIAARPSDRGVAVHPQRLAALRRGRRVVPRRGAAADPGAEPAAARARTDEPHSGDVRRGLHLLWHDRVLRVLAMCIFVMNVTLGATMAVLVIYAGERLGLGATGYGLLGAAIAAGGLIGTAVVNRLVQPVRRRACC